MYVQRLCVGQYKLTLQSLQTDNLSTGQRKTLLFYRHFKLMAVLSAMQK